jgi:hypothetical protein
VLLSATDQPFEGFRDTLVVHLALASIEGEFYGNGALEVASVSWGGVRNASKALVYNIGVCL